MSYEFTQADHERAQRAGQAAMAKIEGKRKSRAFWRAVFTFLAVTQLIALVIAVVGFWHPVGFHGAWGVPALFTWPAVVSPQWAALLAAFSAFFLTGLTQAALSEDGASGR
jgi:fatty acid desaturase